MTKITIESEGKKIELTSEKDVVDLNEMLELFEEALYAIGFRFKGQLDFVDEDEQ